MSLIIASSARRKIAKAVADPPPISGLEYVGGATGSHSGDTSPWSVSLTGLTGGLASAPAQGDIVVLCHSTYSGSNEDGGPVAAAGFAEIADLYADDSADANLSVSYKIMTATPDTSVSILGTGYYANYQMVAVSVWRGVDVAVPIDVTSTTATGTNTAKPNPPAITPTTSEAVVLVAGGSSHYLTDQTFTAAELSNFVTAGHGGASVGIGSYEWTSGAFDPAAWGFSGTDASDYSWAAVSLALRPGS